MDEVSGPSIWAQARGFLGDLASAVIQVEQVRDAREIARQNTSGGSAIAPGGELVSNATQRATPPPPPPPLIPQGVWIVGGLGLALVLVALLPRR